MRKTFGAPFKLINRINNKQVEYEKNFGAPFKLINRINNKYRQIMSSYAVIKMSKIIAR